MQVCTIGMTKNNEPVTMFYRTGVRQFGPKTIEKVVAFIESRGQTVLHSCKSFVQCTGTIIASEV
jgi:uncharacterized protein (DUF2237 family)